MRILSVAARPHLLHQELTTLRAARFRVCRWSSMSEAVISMNVEEIQLPVPWGHIAGKSWGDPTKKHVLAVHGWLDNAGSFDRLIPLLSSELHVVAIDWPGHGRSSPRPRGVDYSAYKYVADIKYIVDALKWDKFMLLAHSMGAGAATWFSGCQPGNVEKLVLLEGGPFMSFPAEAIPKMMGRALDNLLSFEHLVDEKTYPTWDAVVDKVLEGQRLSQSSFTRESAAILAERGSRQLGNQKYQMTRDVRLKQQSLARITPDMSAAVCKAIECPILLVRGKESYIRDEFFKQQMELFGSKKYQYVCVPGGHHVHLESPELISQTVNEFLVSDSSDFNGQGKL